MADQDTSEVTEVYDTIGNVVHVGDSVWCDNNWDQLTELATVVDILNSDTVLVEYDDGGLDYYLVDDISLA